MHSKQFGSGPSKHTPSCHRHQLRHHRIPGSQLICRGLHFIITTMSRGGITGEKLAASCLEQCRSWLTITRPQCTIGHEWAMLAKLQGQAAHAQLFPSSGSYLEGNRITVECSHFRWQLQFPLVFKALFIVYGSGKCQDLPQIMAKYYKP